VALHAWMPPGGDLADRRYPSPYTRAIWKQAAAQRCQEAIESAWGGPPLLVSFECPVLAAPPPEPGPKPWSRLSRWSFRHRELTADQVLREAPKLGQGHR
jgi:hypothetical protein